MAKPPERALAATVREHDALLGGLIRGNPLAILVLDATDRVEMVNPAFEDLFGYREAEVVGQLIRSLIVPDELARESDSLSQKGFEGHTTSAITRRRRKDRSLV